VALPARNERRLVTGLDGMVAPFRCDLYRGVRGPHAHP
jgi:hypothetical protein